MKERPSSNLKIVMGGPPTTSTMMTQYKYPQGNPNISKRQQQSGVNGPSPMKLKILPQTVKNSQLRNYKANVQAINSKNGTLRSSLNGASFGGTNSSQIGIQQNLS
jgi:hypothetical protein